MKNCDLMKVPRVIPLEDDMVNFPIRISSEFIEEEGQREEEETSQGQHLWAQVVAEVPKENKKGRLTSKIISISQMLMQGESPQNKIVEAQDTLSPEDTQSVLQRTSIFREGPEIVEVFDSPTQTAGSNNKGDSVSQGSSVSETVVEER